MLLKHPLLPPLLLFVPLILKRNPYWGFAIGAATLASACFGAHV